MSFFRRLSFNGLPLKRSSTRERRTLELVQFTQLGRNFGQLIRFDDERFQRGRLQKSDRELLESIDGEIDEREIPQFTGQIRQIVQLIVREIDHGGLLIARRETRQLREKIRIEAERLQMIEFGEDVRRQRWKLIAPQIQMSKVCQVTNLVENLSQSVRCQRREMSEFGQIGRKTFDQMALTELEKVQLNESPEVWIESVLFVDVFAQLSPAENQFVTTIFLLLRVVQAKERKRKNLTRTFIVGNRDVNRRE